VPQTDHTGFGTHPAFYSVGPGNKTANEVDHPAPSCALVNNNELSLYSPPPLMSSWSVQ